MENHSFPIVRPTCIIISVIPENMWYVFTAEIRRLELMCRFIAELIMKEKENVNV